MHSWHLFDEILSLEVRQVGEDEFEVRRTGYPGTITLSSIEFNVVRTADPDPASFTQWLGSVGGL